MRDFISKYCDDCDKIVVLTEDGYCKYCGKHSDNMTVDYTIGTGSMDDTDSFGSFLNEKHERKSREGLL